MNFRQIGHRRHEANTTLRINGTCVLCTAEVYGFWATKEDAGYWTGWHWYWRITTPEAVLTRYDIEGSEEPYNTMKTTIAALELILHGFWQQVGGKYTWHGC